MIGPGTAPHVGGPIIPPCQVNVIVCGMPQARVTDKSLCATAIPAKIVTGAWNVLVGGQPAARIGDKTSHGGTIITGCPTVLIGTDGGSVNVALSASSVDFHSASQSSVETASPASTSKKVTLREAALDNDKSIFRVCFEEQFGLSVDDAIARFEGRTGKPLSEETIRLLFSDSKKAGEIVKDDDINTTFREIINSHAPKTMQEAEKLGYTKMTNFQSTFHDPDHNVKYVSPNGGHVEGIYNKKTGKLVTNSIFGPTANFFDPNEDPEGHTIADVWPWARKDGPKWLIKSGESYFNNLTKKISEIWAD
nr:PAAR domain-containing protein [uncultured Cohaesibacter sp.]